MRTSQSGSQSPSQQSSYQAAQQSSYQAAQQSVQQRRLELSAGQTYRLHAEAGTAFVALTGSLRIAEAPQWFGDAMLAPQQTIVEGQQHIVERGGWVSIGADRAASIAVLTTATAANPSWTLALDALRKLAHRVTGKTTHLFAR